MKMPTVYAPASIANGLNTIRERHYYLEGNDLAFNEAGYIGEIKDTYPDLIYTAVEQQIGLVHVFQYPDDAAE